ncbi:HXXEE domain-containing protein [Chloroflexota bacterium]
MALPIFFLLRSISPIFPVTILFMVLINALLHILMAIRGKHYNPGLIVSVILSLPVAVYTISLFSPVMTVYSFVLSFIIGFILHATLFIYLFVFQRRSK